MKITILGSAGQIGAYLLGYLSNKGHEVTGIDIVNGEENDLRITPNTYIENVIKNSDFIFFLAFDVGGSRYLKKYQYTFDFIDNNNRIMTNVFSLLEKYKKPFIFVSSNMSNWICSSYGILKRVGEFYTTSLKGLTVKLWNVYGIEHDSEKYHVISDFIKKGFETGVIEMLTDGTEERQFLYAEDCCKALEIVMESYADFKPKDDLHITSFQATTIKDIAKIIQSQFRLIGKGIKIKSGIENGHIQLNVPNSYITDWWKPETGINEGISKVFNVIKDNYV
jgi:nucleoside-diphosphate-sugar epimerase